MAAPFTREEFQTPAGRKRAWRALMLGDHGFLRTIYDNTHEIAPGKMWRTYQPSPAHLERWTAKGVKTVVNLRGDNPNGILFLEEEACERLGLRPIPARRRQRKSCMARANCSRKSNTRRSCIVNPARTARD